MSPEAAAHAAGTTRWTIMRAITAQRLRATRDNRNQWRITPEDLAAWQRAHPAQSALGVREAPAAQPADERTKSAAYPDAALRAEVETLRRELERLERELRTEKARTEGLAGEIAAERVRAEAEAKRADREGVAADDLRARLTSATRELEEERRTFRALVEGIMAPAPDPTPAPPRRRGLLARFLGI